MKTAIVFASRHGAVEELSVKIANGLKAKPDLFDLCKSEEPDLTIYDFVLIGGSIYVGQLLTDVKQFCANNQQALLQKKLALFISCMESEKANEFMTTAFDAHLREHALCLGTLGGRVIADNLFWWEKLLLKFAGRKVKDEFNVQEEKIQAFINCCNSVAIN